MDINKINIPGRNLRTCVSKYAGRNLYTCMKYTRVEIYTICSKFTRAAIIYVVYDCDLIFGTKFNYSGIVESIT